MTSFLRNRMFLEGIALGGICGIILGSVLAFTIGASSVKAIQQVIHKRFPSNHEVPFQYLAQ